MSAAKLTASQKKKKNGSVQFPLGGGADLSDTDSVLVLQTGLDLKTTVQGSRLGLGGIFLLGLPGPGIFDQDLGLQLQKSRSRSFFWTAPTAADVTA